MKINTLMVAALVAGLAVAMNAQVSGPPVEDRPTEAKNQKPVFAQQTRAPGIRGESKYQIVTIAKELNSPWGMAFLPDGRILVTEKPGRLRLVGSDGSISAPVAGVPPVYAGGQAGLLDVALDPDFATNGRIYLSFAEPRPNGFGISVFRGRLSLGTAGGTVGEGQVIYRADVYGGANNLGSRLLFDGKGHLFVTIGDRFSSREQAQSLGSALGKVIRINADGAAPADNPFSAKAGAKPEIWTMGHRNPQGLAFDPDGQLWSVEHGARGGDELNRIEPGKNYGWPVISYGVEYSGEPINGGLTQKNGLEQPVYYWDPVIAPSGLAFYKGDLFPEWKGSVFVGGLRGKHLARLTMAKGLVTGEERLLTELGERIRDVRIGPEGAVYVLTDNPNGRLLKLVPR